MRVNHPPNRSDPPETATIDLVIPARDLAVRDGLKSLLSQHPLCALSEADRGTIEIVLAEVFNNIVEHAYAKSRGDIEVLLKLAADHLQCRIADSGEPMPNGTMPKPDLPDYVEALPEGGFGWLLIRELSTELRYRREGLQNILSFRLKLKRTGQ